LSVVALRSRLEEPGRLVVVTGETTKTETTVGLVRAVGGGASSDTSTNERERRNKTARG
jgi:hypothetical protein